MNAPIRRMTPLELWLEDAELGVAEGDKFDRLRKRRAARGLVQVNVWVPAWAKEELLHFVALRLGEHAEAGDRMPAAPAVFEVSHEPGPPSGNTGGIQTPPLPDFSKDD